MMRYVYAALLVVILVYVAGCEECDDDANLLFVIVCVDGIPTLASSGPPGGPLVLKSGFNSFDYDCSGGTPKPINQQNQTSTTNIPNQGTQSAINQSYTSPGAANGSAGSRAAAQTPQAVLRPDVLSLPFSAIPPAAGSSSANCDPSQPDVLQVGFSINKLTRLATCPFSIRAAIPVAPRPQQVAVTPDGATALVTSFDSAVNFIDLASNKVTFKLNTGIFNPSGLAISPDGTKAYITSFHATNSAVQAIDLATQTVTATVQVPAYPQSVFLTPDGSQAWVTFPQGNGVYVIDTLTNTVATSIGINFTYAIAFNSTGTRAYITSQASAPGTVVAVDTSTYTVVRTYTVGTGPIDIALAYGDRRLFVSNYLEKSLSVVNVATGAVNTTKLAGAPRGLSFVR